MAVLLESIDKVAEINDELPAHVRGFYALRKEDRVLLIKESESASGLLAGAAICRENSEPFSSFAKIGES